MINVIIGGDVCPIGKNLTAFKTGKSKTILNDLYDEFQAADICIVNLEAPLIEKESPILKNGPVIGVDSKCINGLKNMGIDIVNLANNHIMDHGANGLINTISLCKENEISTVGAGRNLREAQKLLIVKVGMVRIGIYGIAENEFSIAGTQSWGANPINIANIVRTINNSKANVDYLIVLVHGGNENYPYPSPQLKELCEFLVEIGANAVIVQHTHCPGCLQQYEKSHIVYGQGNFIFDRPKRNQAFYEGFLIKLAIDEDFKSEMKIIPYLQSQNHPGVIRMKNKEEEQFLESIVKRSKEIEDERLVSYMWGEYCKTKKMEYINKIYGHNMLIRKMINFGFYERLFLTPKTVAKLKNIISCESHKDVLEAILNKMWLREKP